MPTAHRVRTIFHVQQDFTLASRLTDVALQTEAGANILTETSQALLAERFSLMAHTHSAHRIGRAAFIAKKESS